jgi:DNA-binding XRE family transcriptional regulator
MGSAVSREGDKPTTSGEAVGAKIISPERRLFAENFRQARIAAGLSQTDVHELTGLTQPYISEVETCVSNPTLDIAAKLANAVRVPLYELLKPKS